MNWRKIRNIPTGVWTHVYGSAGLIGLVASIIVTIKTFNSTSENGLENVVIILSISLFLVYSSFILSSLYYINERKKYYNYPLKVRELEEEVLKSQQIHQVQSECLHTINHYYRNIAAELDYFANFKVEEKTEFVSDILKKTEYFMINSTASLQQYFSEVSGSQCAITIKQLSPDGRLVKTFFRDPVNLKKRRNFESYYSDCQDYPVDSNTAFELILSNEYANVYFASDDLQELYDEFQYKNSNDRWRQLYNATIVVPISIVEGQYDRSVLGFLAVDNLDGNLASKANVELLFAVGDLFYAFFVKLGELYSFAKKINEKGEIDSLVEKYYCWNSDV